MTAHRRTEVTVETDRVLIIQRRRVIRTWCQECGGEGEIGDSQVPHFSQRTGEVE